LSLLAAPPLLLPLLHHCENSKDELRRRTRRCQLALLAPPLMMPPALADTPGMLVYFFDLTRHSCIAYSEDIAGGTTPTDGTT